MTATSRPSIPASRTSRASAATAVTTGMTSPSAAEWIVAYTQKNVSIPQATNSTTPNVTRGTLRSAGACAAVLIMLPAR